MAARCVFDGLPWRAVGWSPAARRLRGRFVAQSAKAAGVDHVFCCGTIDCPVGEGIDYSIWLDNSWNLLRNSAVALPWSTSALDKIDAIEKVVLGSAKRVLTFSQHLRDDMIAHYGLPPEKVVTVGCGSGPVAPFSGTKNYAQGHLLFVAKHLFAEKGGELALEALRLVREVRPDTRLVIVGSDEVDARVSSIAGVEAYGWISQDRLNELYADAAMLVQPMLGDPWGQVYLEAMKAKAIIVALNRAALPELTDQGRLAALIDAPDPNLLAEAILRTYERPQIELEVIAAEAQARCQQLFAWPIVAKRVVQALNENRMD